MAEPQSNLVYAKKTNRWFFLGSLTLLLICIFGFKYWYQLGFNILFFGYFIFRELRLATMFYATVVRIILYPSALINKALEGHFKKTETQYEKIQKIENAFERDSQKRDLLASKNKVLLYSWFHLCFLTMNAVTIGVIFFQKFTREKLSSILYTDFYLPKNYPISTTAFIPLVGEVDLAIPNLKLNFYSAVGAGIVGLFEIIFNKKVSKRQLVKYLIFFPLGAYYLTYWVPSGFEFALIVFEILTAGIILVEKIKQSTVYKSVKQAAAPPAGANVKKEEVKNLIKEVITEANQDNK